MRGGVYLLSMLKTVDSFHYQCIQAIAGERQERDSSNNPQIPDEKVPRNSAASKTSSGEESLHTR